MRRCEQKNQINDLNQCEVKKNETGNVQGGSNRTGTNCDLFTHKQSRSYLNHLVRIEERSRNNCCSGKAISITYWSVCACLRVRACAYPGVWACACAYVHIALLIQHATRVRIVTSFMATRSQLNYSTFSHKRCSFLKKVIEHKICVFIFSTNSV
jgi:hypothetical protein